MRESILTASSDKSIRKWSIDEETCEGTFKGHKGSVFKITQMDANLFATAANDNMVKVWDFTTLECIRSLETHTDAISSVMFIEGEGLLVSASMDGTIAVWSPYYGSHPLQRKINQEAPVKHAIYLGKMVLSLRDLAQDETEPAEEMNLEESKEVPFPQGPKGKNESKGISISARGSHPALEDRLFGYKRGSTTSGPGGAPSEAKERGPRIKGNMPNLRLT